MNRRNFIKLCGLTPFAGLLGCKKRNEDVTIANNIVKPARWKPISEYEHGKWRTWSDVDKAVDEIARLHGAYPVYVRFSPPGHYMVMIKGSGVVYGRTEMQVVSEFTEWFTKNA